MGRDSELYKVITLNDAMEILKPYVLPYYNRTEETPLGESLGRIVASDVVTCQPLPNFRKSTVDGMALKASETFGTSETLPALIECCGEIIMGEAPTRSLHPREGMLIPTGGMLPEAADAVVKIEHLEHYGGGLYGVVKPAVPGENIIEIGEDLSYGEIILPRLSRIRAQEMGLLASQGMVRVPVLPQFRVGIISSGDEIIDPAREPAPAQTRDINGYTLLGQAQAAGAKARYYGIINDNLQDLREKIQQILQENDIAILSGGSSVGVRDHSAKLISELGEPGLLFHGLALRPGKPTIAGAVNNKLIFGVPGHPASAMVAFETIIRPWLDATFVRNKVEILPEAILTQNIYAGTGMEEYVRVRLIREGNCWLAEPIRGKSGLIRTMVLAEGLVHIPLDTEGIEKGQAVRIFLLR